MLMLLLPVPLVAVAGIDAVARASLPSAVSVLFRPILTLGPTTCAPDLQNRLAERRRQALGVPGVGAWLSA
ncbi:hypothetical protein [Xanthomonas campestris]|uniref:hypothetical protein n=1 Tax=Xanthomonas campestris TaxID=339 RepID=UPI0023677E5F|nr:hypothetical protein [Xanthomonas campestris]WDI93692.1 hypothetical protein JH280_21220 [Xanthomonas campestris]